MHAGDCVVELEAVERPRSIPGVVTGMLLGFSSEGPTPLVIFAGQPGSAAVPARSDRTAVHCEPAHRPTMRIVHSRW